MMNCNNNNVMVILLLLLLIVVIQTAHACTTISVGKDASSDGSVLCSHSNDGEGDTDPRLVLIPSSDWPSGTMRPVFYSPESYPRYVGNERASTTIVPAYYEPSRSIKNSTITRAFEKICAIPQVNHTYQYFEETYGAHNEKQLGIAESTCSGVFGAAPKGIIVNNQKTMMGKACFSIDALTQIAMERHSRARHAIQEMGALAEQMGFYGAGLFEGTAESLIVTDVNEAWVFHILPDPTGTSAIWAAQRVPDDSFAVVPNVFIIRNIDRDNSDPETGDFLYSESVYSVAQDLEWWSESDGRPLDFTATYSDGEYASKYYSGRRAWGVYSLFAPSLDLSPDYVEWRISKPYPFAAKPDDKISLQALADAMRYFYQDTEYHYAQAKKGSEKSLLLSGGVWQSPDHVAGHNSTPMPNNGVNKYGIAGNWERTIGLYRTSDSYISQSRGWLADSHGGVLWFGAYAAPYTIYTPFSGGMTSLPNATLGHHMTLDKSTLFWANRYLGNYVQLKWNAMMEEVVEFQNAMMQSNLKLQAHIDSLMANGGGSSAGDDPLHLYAENADHVVAKTWELCDHLMFKYADGQVHYTSEPLGTSTTPRTYDAKGATTTGAAVTDQPGYPGDWLDAVGYPDGPPPPPNCADLDWQCGHKPNKTNDNAGLGVRCKYGSAWLKWLEQREVARNEGTACANRGDAAAAAGGCDKAGSTTEGGSSSPRATSRAYAIKN